MLTRVEAPPHAEELRKVLEGPLSAAAETLGFEQLRIEPVRTSGTFLKLVVRAGEVVLFTIDLTKMSAVIKSELVLLPVDSDSEERIMISVPSRDLQLLFKAEAFLERRFLKARDAFDIKLLMDSGATLDSELKAHLEDGSAGEKLEDSEFIARRIEQVNSRTCRPELQPYLPEPLYEELERVDFETLRQALRDLFSEWL